MREICLANLAAPKIAHKLAKSKGPPPLAVAPMLGLTRMPGQADADLGIYDFSLENSRLSRFLRPLQAIPPETVICEQHSLDARDGVAHRHPLFPFRGQMGRPRPACGGDRH